MIYFLTSSLFNVMLSFEFHTDTIFVYLPVVVCIQLLYSDYPSGNVVKLPKKFSGINDFIGKGG